MIFTSKRLYVGLLMAAAFGMRAAADVPTAYAYQMGDETNRFGYVSFPINDVNAKTMLKSSSSYSNQLGAADYVDGKLYGFTLEVDDFGAINTEAYVVIDPNSNFKETKSIDKAYDNRVVDMAYDYTTNRMYALVEMKPATGKIVTTALHVVDLNTGDLYLVGLPGDLKAIDGYGRDAEEVLVGLAASPTGDLYAMGDFRQFYKIDKLTGEATKVGKPHKVAIDNCFQSMSFSGDGMLYHAHCHPDYEYVMRIDPQSGKIYNPNTGDEVVVNSDFSNNGLRVNGNPQLTSLYFTDKAVDAESPAAPSSLKATLREGTPNTVDLAWALPAANSAATGVWVYRFGSTEAIAKLPADATAFVDENAPSGKVAYSVVVVDGEHIGMPVYADVQSGADMLKAVTNLKAEIDGSEVSLSWTAPTETVNGGYADYDNITYIVTLINGSKRTIIASACEETAYKYELTDGGTFSFEVVPVSCGIEGTAAMSNEVTLEKTFAAPYSTGFEDDQDGTLWTIVNNGSANYGWSIILGYAYQRLEGKFAQFKTGGGATIPADDWMISPAIAFEGGDYVLTYFANGGSYDSHSYEIAIGTDASDVSSFAQVIEKVDNEKIYGGDDNNNYVARTVKFSVAKGGEYHIGLHGIGCATFATVKIDNLSIDKDVTGGLNGVAVDQAPETVTIVSIDGRVIVRDAAPEAVDSLQPGIYIVNGRKICVTK